MRLSETLKWYEKLQVGDTGFSCQELGFVCYVRYGMESNFSSGKHVSISTDGIPN